MKVPQRQATSRLLKLTPLNSARLSLRQYGIVFEASRMDSHYINKLRKGPERDREIGALGPHSDHRWSSLPRQLCQSLCFASAHFIGNVRGIPPAKDSPAFLPASKL